MLSAHQGWFGVALNVGRILGVPVDAPILKRNHLVMMRSW